jgi:hypothetical protein
MSLAMRLVKATEAPQLRPIGSFVDGCWPYGVRIFFVAGGADVCITAHSGDVEHPSDLQFKASSIRMDSTSAL